MDTSKVVFANIDRIIQAGSLARLKTLLGVDVIMLGEDSFPHLMPGEYMGAILISSEQLRIFYKVFFDLTTIEEMFKQVRLPPTLGKPSLEFIKDYMREFCNLVAGFIMANLEKNKIQSSISLPLALQSFDDFFFPHEREGYSKESHWAIQFGEQKLYFATLIEVLADEGLVEIGDPNLTIIETHEGEVDFL